MGAPRSETVPGYVLAAVAASLALLLPFWIVDYLPTHDGPQHIFGVYLYHHLHDVSSGYDQYFQHNIPITNLGFPVLFAALELMLPWRPALALCLTIIALIWSWGFLYLCRALHPDRWLVGILGFAAALQWAMYMGMFSFVLSVGIGFFVLGFALRRTNWSPQDRVKLTCLLTLQAFAHVFGAAASGLVLGFMVLIGSPKGQRIRELLWLFLIALPTLVIGLMSRGSSAAKQTSLGDLLTLTDRLAAPAAAFFTGPWWRRWSLLALSLTGLVWAAGRVRKGRMAAGEITLLVAATLFLIAGVGLPVNFLGWDFAAFRFLPYGAMFAIALLPSERLLARSLFERRLAVSAAGLVVLSNIAWQTLYSCELWQRCADALAAIAVPLKRSGTRLPIVLNPDVGLRPLSLSTLVPFAMPLRNIGPLFALEQGGYVPDLFDTIPSVHPYLLKAEVVSRLPKPPSRVQVVPLFLSNPVATQQRAAIVNHMLSFGPQYEDIILSGSPDDLSLALERGFVADYQNDTVLIAHFRGCPAKLHIERNVALPLIVSFGWFPSMDAIQKARLPAGANAATLDLAQAPCGTIWLRVVQDADGSGTLTSGDSVCAAAAADGKVLSTLGPMPNLIDCPLRAVGP